MSTGQRWEFAFGITLVVILTLAALVVPNLPPVKREPVRQAEVKASPAARATWDSVR